VLRLPSRSQAAMVVDRRLAGYDRVSTALELVRLADLDEHEQRQVKAAAAWAEACTLDGFGPRRPPARLAALAALALVGSAALALVPSPADQALAEQRAEQELIEEEADRLDELAEELPAQVAEEVREIAARLRESRDLEQALAELGEARRQLAELADPVDLARKTALSGLEQRLRQAGLAEGETALDQLRDLADRAETLTEEQRAAAATELEARTDDLAGIDNELSEALDEAAEALRRGQGAAEAVERAGGELERASAEVARSEARARAQGAVRDAQARLDQARQGQGEGQGEAQGQGQGEGEGEGEGQGQGAGGGGAGSTPGASGGGGEVPSGRGDDDPARGPARSSVFDPVAFGIGDEVRVPGEGGLPGDPIGTTPGTGVENLPLTPYAERYAEYQRAALDALDSLSVPAGLRELVRDYFTELEP
ncbi:MAG: hypothetical protein ACRDVM_06380, partial [Acidimicrobiia bacterium]